MSAGSSTVEPISTGVAEAFKAANPDWNYTITGEGTGDGFQRFCSAPMKNTNNISTNSDTATRSPTLNVFSVFVAIGD